MSGNSQHRMKVHSVEDEKMNEVNEANVMIRSSNRSICDAVRC